MLFNSFEFLFIFLPIAIAGYFMLTARNWYTASIVWLILSSLVFYGYWNVIYVPLMLASIVINFGFGMILNREITPRLRKLTLIIGIGFNIALLGYFKYVDFFISNMNQVLLNDWSLLKIALPLAISFFTFQQISYIVDCYRNELREKSFLNYMLFITFFPHLIAGPITHHNEMMPQFADQSQKRFNYANVALGIFIFSIGLFKKVIIADTFALWVKEGYANTEALTLLEGWMLSISYTIQLYFDFSGYSDMAIGLALLFNIRLPLNFNSPYKSRNIAEFWQRWHMTLTRFLTQYLYIPLGGNRKGIRRTYINILLVFVISGFWHGAAWTFVFWGFLHGIATLIHRYWQSFHIKMNSILAWFITFNFINITWVFFRANTWSDAWNVIGAMFGLQGITFPNTTFWKQAINNAKATLTLIEEINISFRPLFIGDEELLLFIMFLCISLVLILWVKNTLEMSRTFKPTFILAITIAAMNVYSVLHFSRFSEFIYFNF
jgi:alginate O-acetyltransferase complex protein AlgI